MSSNDVSGGIVVGIDLGTTNSSIGVTMNGQPVLIPIEGQPLLPSVVGLAPDGSLLVGRAARNQAVLYPERTIRSVKRRMGEDVRLPLGERQHTPVEVSAIILRQLKLAAETYLGQPVARAVITVPAYFSDAQRTATREAGEVAGFVVERVLHEPTAAALCYAGEGPGAATERKVLVYDLGGGTFDVSILRQQGEVTEVLASHGDTHLGGDDFDQVLARWLQQRFEAQHGVSLREDRRALARLSRLAEETKIQLSRDSYVRAIAEDLGEQDGRPLHLDVEVDRHGYEELIRPLVERTKDSVQLALREAGLLARQLDEVILVGGATRTPLVGELLQGLLGRAPRLDVDPDQAVALGATLHAARLAGLPVQQILVDVTPFSFGTAYFGVLDGRPSTHCYKQIVPRNSPLPIRQTEVFFTMQDGQRRVQVEVYQGEHPDTRQNIPLGHFLVEGLDPEAPEGSPVLFEMQLDLDGILHVEVMEKHTGLHKGLTIENAFRKLGPDELARARAEVAALFPSPEAGDAIAEEDEDDDLEVDAPGADGPGVGGAGVGGDGQVEEGAAGTGRELPRPPQELNAEQRASWSTAVSLIEKADRLVPRLGRLDREELTGLTGRLVTALGEAEFATIEQLREELADVIFYLE